MAIIAESPNVAMGYDIKIAYEHCKMTDTENISQEMFFHFWKIFYAFSNVKSFS